MPQAQIKSITDQSPTGVLLVGQFVCADVGGHQVCSEPRQGRVSGRQALIDLVRLLARSAAMEQLASLTPPYKPRE